MLSVIVISATKVMGLLKIISAGFSGAGSMFFKCKYLKQVVVVLPLHGTEYTFRAGFRRPSWMSS